MLFHQDDALTHSSAVKSLTGKEWQIAYDPSSLIGQGHQSFIGMEEIGEN